MKEHYTNLSEFFNDIMNTVKDECIKEEKIKTEKNIEHPFDDTKNKCNESCLKPMPGNIRIEDNHYILNEMIAGWPTTYEQHIYFENVNNEGYRSPGITESQLLSVLYDRYKSEPKKLALIRELMN